MKDLKFGEAVELAKAGCNVAREKWNGKNMWITIQNPTPKSKMSRPYLYMKTVDNELVPWVASQTDILAEDWYEVKTSLYR